MDVPGKFEIVIEFDTPTDDVVSVGMLQWCTPSRTASFVPVAQHGNLSIVRPDVQSHTTNLSVDRVLVAENHNG